MSNLLKLNLQFFNDGEFESGGIIENGPTENVIRGGYNPEAEIEAPTVPNPLVEEAHTSEQPLELNFEDAQQPQEPYEGQFQEPVQPQQPQVDPYLQQMMLQNQQLQAQMMSMQQLMAQQQQTQMPIAEPEPQLSLEEQNEQLMERFYENPTQFIQEIEQRAQARAMEQITPIIKERQIQTEIDGLKNKYGQDFHNYIEPMRNLVTELGDTEVERIGLERVFLMAKGMSVNAQPQVSPDQIFQDQGFVNNYIAQNPQVQQAVINNYLASKQQQQPPKVMGSQSGSAPSLAPEQRPKSIAESSRLLRKSWGY